MEIMIGHWRTIDQRWQVIDYPVVWGEPRRASSDRICAATVRGHGQISGRLAAGVDGRYGRTAPGPGGRAGAMGRESPHGA